MDTEQTVVLTNVRKLTVEPGPVRYHGGSEKPGKPEVGGASRDSTGLGALEEGLISS